MFNLILFIVICLWIISLIKWIFKKIGFIGNIILFAAWLYLANIFL